jgi:ZIP family zinc transporter
MRHRGLINVNRHRHVFHEIVSKHCEEYKPRQTGVRGVHPILNILLLSSVASLGTGLGGLIVLIRKPGRRTFGFLMGIASGVMISLSFLELVNKAWQMAGYMTATVGFGLGAMFMFVIDTLIPHIRFGETEVPGNKPDIPSTISREFQAVHRNQHKKHTWFQRTSVPMDRGLFKSGMLIAIGIAIHNMPEGVAVGAGYAHQPQFGYFIALAIALHNIPEGIATALPLCKAGARRWDAFRIALLSGMTEPVGALLAILFLSAFRDLVPSALAFAGGVMTFITLDELIPAAREHGHQHWTAIGIILGAIFVFLLSGIFGV